MKSIILFALLTFSVFANDCTFSVNAKYGTNTKENIGQTNKFTAQEKELIWDLKRTISSNLNCTLVKENALFHIELDVFRYYKKTEYFGLTFKEDESRSVGFSIDYNNEFYKGFKYTTNNRDMVDQSIRFMLSKM